MTIKRKHNLSLRYKNNGTEITVLFTDEYCSFYTPNDPEPIFGIGREIVDILAHQWPDGTEGCHGEGAD